MLPFGHFKVAKDIRSFVTRQTYLTLPEEFFPL